MTYRAIDVETTGLPSDDDSAPKSGIMEIGYCDMKNHIIKPPVAHLVDCGIPVTHGARGTHHISDEMVAGEMKPDQALSLSAAGEHVYCIAHKVDHEKLYVGTGFIPEGSEPEWLDKSAEGPHLRPWICTYKIALRLWPEAENHKLMTLRYFLDLDAAEDFDPKLATPPHRAGADSYVTMHLWRRILVEAGNQKIDVERLTKWSAGPALLYMCYLKKHKGTPWKDVPKDYLSWIVDKSDITDRDIRATAKYYLTR
jgi:exodeoxyribonuclease X